MKFDDFLYSFIVRFRVFPGESSSVKQRSQLMFIAYIYGFAPWDQGITHLSWLPLRWEDLSQEGNNVLST